MTLTIEDMILLQTLPFLIMVVLHTRLLDRCKKGVQDRIEILKDAEVQAHNTLRGAVKERYLYQSIADSMKVSDAHTFLASRLINMDKAVEIKYKQVEEYRIAQLEEGK